MDYNKSKVRFNAYVEQCKQEIIKQFFPNEAHLLNQGNIILENNTFGLILTKDEQQKRKVMNTRLSMIKQKVDHTMRMVEQIIRINEEMGISLDFQQVMKFAVLYHDIGRFEQATWSPSFSDETYKTKIYPNGETFKNHGQAGKKIFLGNNFEVDEQYAPIIGETIFHHVNPEENEKTKYQYGSLSEVRGLNVKEIATGNSASLLNEAEWHLVAIITQLVADIDKVDIFFQYLTGEIEIFRPYVVDDSQRTMDEIALDWGIKKEEILDYNEIEEEEYEKMENKKIKIPVETLNLSKLEVPQDFKNMFYDYCTQNNEEVKKIWGSIPTLTKIYPKWSYVYALWWRVGRFIKDINFYSVLISIEECKLLEEVYKQMPDKYKPLISEPIDYAINTLIPQKKGKEPRLYAKK